MHSRTTSPSSLISRRRTPWVEGCCGPMLTHISSMDSAGAMRMGGTPLASRKRRTVHVDGETVQRILTLEWWKDICAAHHEQRRMSDLTRLSPVALAPGGP